MGNYISIIEIGMPPDNRAMGKKFLQRMAISCWNWKILSKATSIRKRTKPSLIRKKREEQSDWQSSLHITWQIPGWILPSWQWYLKVFRWKSGLLLQRDWFPVLPPQENRNSRITPNG